ncbi:MAG: rRNA methylase [Candidatus Cloacimonetes bacterium HGW-Cloacimonetes-1]|jgi:TrmH family RNA methyltransferase|nr:MAG: rRNA methylase [Candidatus Cloacimonetes bacterium HGW-Cloacimonetes-1]
MNNCLSIERLKYLSKLIQKKYRQQFQQVIVEGKNTIEQLICNGNYPSEIYYTEDPEKTYKDIPTLQVSKKEMLRICDVDSPQSIAALYNIPVFLEQKYTRALYLDGINDPGNLGSIFRSASAFGIDLIAISPNSCETFSPKVIRSSLGSVFWIPHIVADAAWFQEISATKICADMNGGTPLKLFKYDCKKSVIIAIGSEAHGVSSEIRAACSDIVNIEMTSEMESINASVAAGIMCWSLFSN